MRADIPDYPETSVPGRNASLINFILGIWILISPFVLGFVESESLLWNNVLVGIAVAAIAGVCAWSRRRGHSGLSWINFVLGIWLVISPFVFGLEESAVVTWHQVIVGIGVAVLAALSAMARPSRVEPRIAP